MEVCCLAIPWATTLDKLPLSPILFILQITVDIPELVAEHIIPAGMHPSRAVLETLALEGYRSQELTEYEVQQMLGFATSMEVHAFLKDHNTYLHYSIQDLTKTWQRWSASSPRKRCSCERDRRRRYTLNSLIRIGYLDILTELYGRVLAPPAVLTVDSSLYTAFWAPKIFTIQAKCFCLVYSAANSYRIRKFTAIDNP